MADRRNIVTAAGTICLDGVDLGLTRGGVTVVFERDFIETEADQIRGIAVRSLESERVYVRTTLLELTLENLQIAWGQPSDNLTGGTTLCLGYNADCGMPEHSMVIKTKGPQCGCRTFVFDTVVNVTSSSEYKMDRTESTGVDVEFEVLVDEETGEFGCIHDGCTFQDAQDCE